MMYSSGTMQLSSSSVREARYFLSSGVRMFELVGLGHSDGKMSPRSSARHSMAVGENETGHPPLDGAATAPTSAVGMTRGLSPEHDTQKRSAFDAFHLALRMCTVLLSKYDVLRPASIMVCVSTAAAAWALIRVCSSGRLSATISRSTSRPPRCSQRLPKERSRGGPASRISRIIGSAMPFR